MPSCAPIVTKYQLMPEKVEALLAGTENTLTLSTTPYAQELSSLEQQYWRFHTPWGQTGDLLHILEDFRVDKVCQTAESYHVTIVYRDGASISHEVPTPMAVTAKGAFISAQGAVPDVAIRLKLVIQDVQFVGEDWVFTVARV